MRKISLLIIVLLELMYVDVVYASSPAGTIKIWSSSNIPEGYLLCDGKEISRTTYSALFNIIGTTYGSGNGTTTFNLPNFGGKSLIGSNSSYKLGNSGGSITSKLLTVPSHNHSIPKLSGNTVSAGAHTHYIDSASTTAYTFTLAKNSNSVSNRWLDYTKKTGFKTTTVANWYAEWGKGTVNKIASAGAHTHTVTTNASTSESVGSGSTFNVQNQYTTVNYIIKY